jgi:Protein of unknown function (DUF3987)
MTTSFLTDYLAYTKDSEVPASFHRWSAIAGIGAILERNIFIPHGHSHIYPNQYLMLIGTAGTRKSTAIKLMKNLLKQAGYNNISAERTSKEKFLMDLAGDDEDKPADENILDKNLWGSATDTDSEIRSTFIGADEANDFFGIGNLEFLSILGSLWDWTGPPYSNRIKTGKSVSIPNPTVSILAGNTPTGFSVAFPPDILGQGFFSRLLLVYGEPNGRRIAFPRTPDPQETHHIVTSLQAIKSYHYGQVEYTSDAEKLLTHIYNVSAPPSDMRFDSYYNRRFTHLLKLCLIVAASTRQKVITERCVVEANTYLSYAENLMSKALGEFGKSKNSDVTHKILSYIESKDGCSLKELIKLVSSDLEKTSDIGDIIRKLATAEKIQTVHGIFLPMRKKTLTDTSGLTDLSFLTPEELAVKG